MLSDICVLDLSRGRTKEGFQSLENAPRGSEASQGRGLPKCGRHRSRPWPHCCLAHQRLGLPGEMLKCPVDHPADDFRTLTLVPRRSGLSTLFYPKARSSMWRYSMVDSFRWRARVLTVLWRGWLDYTCISSWCEHARTSSG